MTVDYTKRCRTNMLVDGLCFQVIRYGARAADFSEPIWTDVRDEFLDSYGRRRVPGVAHEIPTRFFFSERIE